MKRVGIIGRTNVGKSTLFNHLIKQEKSIVSSIAGTTRDFVSGRIMVGDQEIELIDFGGLEFNVKETIGKGVQEKIYKNIVRLDLIIFMVDGKTEITNEDKRIAEIIRKSKKPAILAVNKVDGKKQKENIYDFYSLGFDDVVGISAVNNQNLEALILEISKKLKLKNKKKSLKINKALTKITIIGKPNVGKSSLFNRLCGEERSIVTQIPGTTRDTIDAEIKLGGKDYLFIDTAGLRRKTKIAGLLEKESSYRSIHAINTADIVLYLLDTNQYATAYDIKLLGYALKKGKPILIVVNKWDLKPADMTPNKYQEILIADNSLFRNLPFVFVSAVKGHGIDDLISEINKLEKKLGFKIKTSVLNQELRKIMHVIGGAKQKLFYATQIGENPLEILLFVNNKKFFNKKQLDLIKKKFGERFELVGIPIFLKLRERERKD